MTADLSQRLQQLRGELDDHSRIARHLGLDFDRPIRSLGDGYPENTISWVGKISEKILKELWRHHAVPGDPGGKTLSQLIKGCRPHISSGTVLDALQDIQRLRNRSVHDGYEIAEEDGLSAVRRLVDVLTWFTTTGSAILTGDVPRLTPLVAKRAEFLSGLYLTLGYRLVKRFELSQHTVYQLFTREVGLRTEYVELLLSRDAREVQNVLETTNGELLQTRLPKLTRFLILESNGEGRSGDLADYRVVTYDLFLDTFVDVAAHCAQFTPEWAPEETLDPLAADLLTTDARSGDSTLTTLGDAAELLDETASAGGNVLVVGRSGSGKSTLLQNLIATGTRSHTRRYRFYFDLSLKEREESFSEFVSRILAPCMRVEPTRVFELFHYFARTGSIVCALDAIDEAVAEHSQAGFLSLFTEVAEVLSAHSAVVLSSRVSFLEDSPQVRRLLDGAELISEKLVQQLHSEGIDPLKVPRFSVLRLRDETSPLEQRLSGIVGRSAPLPDLVQAHLEHVAAEAGPAGILRTWAEYFGGAALEGRTAFSLIDLYNALGASSFDQGRIEFDRFLLRDLFRPAGGDRLAFRHVAYQELLAARLLSDARELDRAVGGRVTEQIRSFLRHVSTNRAGVEDCVLPTGTYLVGPSHHLMLRRVERPLRFDRCAVTVRQYNQFLQAIDQCGATQWEHPDQPDHISHQPWTDRLRIQHYYTDPRYRDHPAICVSWWSAYAFASFEGKRLPTSLEWEAAARGRDGRLFPWGDDVDIAAVNCADAYSERPLITYETWLEEHDRGRLRNALPRPVEGSDRNRSPFGIRQMVGNVWEFTSTALEETGDVVICGGSFDNPYKAVQASSKGAFRPRGSSNAVGFRCVEEI